MSNTLVYLKEEGTLGVIFEDKILYWVEGIQYELDEFNTDYIIISELDKEFSPDLI